MSFQSPQNRSLLLKKIDAYVQKEYSIKLGPEFNQILDDIIKTIARCGIKKSNCSDEQHIKNLNKKCIQEAIRYITENLNRFPKIKDSNLYRSTDDLYQQRQMDSDYRGRDISQGQNGSLGPMNSQSNFQSPMQLSDTSSTDQAWKIALEQRKRDFPMMTQPAAESPVSSTPFGMVNQSPEQTVMNMLLHTPLARSEPSLLPGLVNEITQTHHLMEQLSTNPNGFQQQINCSQFLEMLASRVRGKNNDRMKPFDIKSEVPSTSICDGTLSIEQLQQNRDRQEQEIISGRGNGNSFGNGGHAVNLMNQYIPPSEQLINNVLPDLDDIHLIDYFLCLDFRSDLDQSDKDWIYPLRFNPYGNISKIELVSCTIPDCDVLVGEPYLYVKIEELGGRCYTSSHDVIFGKVLLDHHGDYYRCVPDRGSCFQCFSQPKTLQRLTLTFLNHQGKTLNLREIITTKTRKFTEKSEDIPEKNTKQKKLKFSTQFKHKLNPGDPIEVQIIRKNEALTHLSQVDTVIDDLTFTVSGISDDYPSKARVTVLRSSIGCTFQFRMFEINWNLLTKKNLQNAQLIRLSQLVKDRRRDVAQTIGSEQDIIDYVKAKQPQPQPYM